MPRQSPQAVSRGRFSCRPPLGVRRCVVHRTILPSRTPPGGAAQSNQVVAYSPGLAGCAGVSLPTPRRRYPFSRPPSVRGAPLECRFRSSPPTHHGGDRTRRHDGESRPCRRTPLGLLSQGATPAHGGGVNCKQSSAGAPAIPVTADRSGSAYGCRRASRRSRLVWPGAPRPRRISAPEATLVLEPTAPGRAGGGRAGPHPGCAPPITRRWRVMTGGAPNLPFQPSPRGRHPRSCS